MSKELKEFILEATVVCLILANLYIVFNYKSFPIQAIIGVMGFDILVVIPLICVIGFKLIDKKERKLKI